MMSPGFWDLSKTPVSSFLPLSFFVNSSGVTSSVERHWWRHSRNQAEPVEQLCVVLCEQSQCYWREKQRSLDYRVNLEQGDSLNESREEREKSCDRDTLFTCKWYTLRSIDSEMSVAAAWVWLRTLFSVTFVWTVLTYRAAYSCRDLWSRKKFKIINISSCRILFVNHFLDKLGVSNNI